MDRDTAVREVLMTAESYLKNTDRLIYSYAGKTYLSGAPILDRDFQDRGNIDCSTYVHLVLQGVPYEESPYVTGNAEDTFRSAAAWREAQFAEALRMDAPARRAYGLAAWYYLMGRSFEEREKVQPGDLVFYAAPAEAAPYYIAHGAFRAIAHVGIVSEDTEYIYHSTGYPEKARSEKENLKAIQRTHILEGRTPNLYARPFYGEPGGAGVSR
ncbi:MAG: hypothetical protein II594_01425 [Clostridium sp.]|nr:hypothetical protein [Clostridium sp.]